MEDLVVEGFMVEVVDSMAVVFMVAGIVAAFTVVVHAVV
jgi:hypothetical protein